MSKTTRLIRREYKAAVKTKGFVIGLLLAPVLFGGSAIAMLLLKGRVDTQDKILAVIDHSGLVGPVLAQAAAKRNARDILDPETGKKRKPAYLVEQIDPDREDPDRQRLALSARVRKGALHAFLEVGPEVLTPAKGKAGSRITYHARSAAIDPLRGWAGSILNNHLRRERARRYGVPAAEIGSLLAWIDPEPMGLVSADPATGEVKRARRTSREETLLVPLIVVMLMFMMMMMGAMPLLSAVMEEKTMRIAEVILGSMRPFQFMMGKVLGGTAVGMTCLIVYAAGGILTLSWLGLDRFIPYRALPWFFLFTILAMLMMGSLLAALGAACNDAKEAQALTFPAMLPLMIPMFTMTPIAFEPTTTFATWLSLIPPFTPMLMTLRLATPGGVPAWQPWVGLAGVLLFTLFIIWAGGRIFRVAILMQGTPPKLRNLVRWALRG